MLRSGGPVGQPDSPEVTVLNALGYNSGASLSPQTFTSYYLGPSVDSFGSAPFTIAPPPVRPSGHV